MGNTIGQFAFHIIKMDKKDKDGLPFNPIVTIVLDHWSTSERDKIPTISADLMSESEIDYHVKALKDDLDAVGKKAKAALRKARDETRAIVSARVEARGKSG